MENTRYTTQYSVRTTQRNATVDKLTKPTPSKWRKGANAPVSRPILRLPFPLPPWRRKLSALRRSQLRMPCDRPSCLDKATSTPPRRCRSSLICRGSHVFRLILHTVQFGRNSSWSQFLSESYSNKKEAFARQPAETLVSILTSANHHVAPLLLSSRQMLPSRRHPPSGDAVVPDSSAYGSPPQDCGRTGYVLKQ